MHKVKVIVWITRLSVPLLFAIPVWSGAETPPAEHRESTTDQALTWPVAPPGGKPAPLPAPFPATGPAASHLPPAASGAYGYYGPGAPAFYGYPASTAMPLPSPAAAEVQTDPRPAPISNNPEFLRLVRQVQQHQYVIERLHAQQEQLMKEHGQLQASLQSSQQLLHHAQLALQRTVAGRYTEAHSLTPVAVNHRESGVEPALPESHASDIQESAPAEAGLQAQLDDSEARQQEMDQQLAQANEELELQRGQLAALQLELSQQAEALLQREAELAARDLRLATLQQQLDENVESQQQVQMETSAVNNGLQQQLQQVEQAALACEQEKQTIASARHDLEAQLVQERDQLQQLGMEGEQWQQALDACSAERDRLALDRDAVRSELQALRQGSDSLDGNAEAQVAAATLAPIASAHRMISSSDQAEEDGDQDGLANRLDLCPDKPGAPESLGCPAQGPLVLDIQFGHDANELAAVARDRLQRLAGILRQMPASRHEIAGHTDNTGDPAYNLWLSEQRAESVRQALIEHGVDGDRLIVRGYGGSQPLVENASREQKRRNRRVELRSLPPES